MRAVSLLVLSVALTACSANSSTTNTMNVDENLTTLETNTTSADAQPLPKVHNYDDKDGNAYEYISAVSDEDTKKGKAVGTVSLFAFRGVFAGRYRISSVDNQGHTEWYFECPNPCVVIKEYREGQLVNRVPYNPASVIGSAFEDAFNGFLEVSKEPKPALPPAYSAPATPYYAAPTQPATSEPQTSDAGENAV